MKWPEGFICNRCYQRATRRRGDCPSCRQPRLLPWLDEGGVPTCVDCAGIPVDLRCTRCGDEHEPYRRGLCARCSLDDYLSQLLAGGTGKARPELTGFHAALVGQTHPRSAFIWLRNPVVRNLLNDIASGRAPLTHAGIAAAGSHRATGHVRELLEATGALPRTDRHLAAFQAWLSHKLELLADPDVRRHVHRFATWHHLRRLRVLSAGGTLTDRQVHNAKQEVTAAAAFVTWLAARGRCAAECKQANVDAWLAAGPTTRSTARTFVVWAGNKRLMPRLDFPHRVPRGSRIVTQEQRIEQLRSLVTDDSLALPFRLAGILMLLYAQPLTRVCRLRREDIESSGDTVTIRLGGSTPAPIPEPFASLARQLLDDHRNTNTAANRESPWLFPGYRPGQPLHVSYVMTKIRDHGIDLLGGRNAAMRQLVLDMPPAVAATVLGYSAQVTERHAAQSGARWARYAGSRR